MAKLVKHNLINKIPLNELEIGSDFLIPEPENNDEIIDRLQNNSTLYFYKPLEESKPIVNPGIYQCVINMYGEGTLVKSEVNIDRHFGGIDIQNQIISDCNTFFSKKHIFDELKIQPRRGYLFYGSPGTGKSHTINNICSKLAESNDTIIIFFNTKKDIYSLSETLKHKTLSQDVKKMVIVFEDLGGGEADPENAYKLSDSSMLSFLDGNLYRPENISIITFATTNYPTNFLANLIDRPGRFDEVIEIKAPSIEVKKTYMETFLKRELTKDEESSLTKNHSMAHVKEAAVKFLVYDKSIKNTLEEQTKHTEKVKNHFEDSRRMGV